MQLERHLAEMAGALKALKQEQQADEGLLKDKTCGKTQNVSNGCLDDLSCSNYSSGNSNVRRYQSA